MTLVSTLGAALWGRSFGDLQSQLLKRYPEIPADFDLPDFRELLNISAEMMAVSAAAHKMAGLSPLLDSTPAIFVGSQSFTQWEARCEIVRRAVEYLEKR